jgi:hypothetical protein
MNAAMKRKPVREAMLSWGPTCKPAARGVIWNMAQTVQLFSMVVSL